MTIDLVLNIAPSSKYTDSDDEDIISNQGAWYSAGNFFNRLRFYPWSDFHHKVRDAKSFVDRLTEEQTHMAHVQLERAKVSLTESDYASARNLANGVITFTVDAAMFLTRCHPEGREGRDVPGEKTCTEEIMSQLIPTEVAGKTENSRDLFHAVHFRWYSIIFDNPTDLEQDAPPSGTVEVRGINDKVVPDDVDGSDVSAVVKWLQTAFDSDPSQKDPAAENFARVLSRASHTKGGFGMLTNHDIAVFMQIGKLNGNRVDVRVSSVYKCNEEEGTVVGMVAWMLECVKAGKVEGLRGSKELYEVLRFFSHRSGVAIRDLKGGGGGCLGEYARERMEMWNELLRKFMLRRDQKGSEAAVMKVRDDALVEEALMGQREFIFGKGSGVITKGRLGATTVAIKYVHQAEWMEAMNYMLNEFVTYCKLRASGADKECLGIAELIGCGVHYWYGPAVVTKFVGKPVRYYGNGSNGTIRVGGLEVGRLEVE